MHESPSTINLPNLITGIFFNIRFVSVPAPNPLEIVAY
jgi:hypothetical protein